MAKQKFEIEVDIPEGYEATGEWRRPKLGDLYLDVDGRIMRADFDFNSHCYHILRKKFVAPAWLTNWKYIARSRLGSVTMWGDGPEPFPTKDGYWCRQYEPGSCESHLNSGMVDFGAMGLDLPDVPWEESLIINPNHQSD